MPARRAHASSTGRRTALLAALSLCACATTVTGTVDKLDPLTAVTITYAVAPLVMYREEPGRAAYARNYLNLGPLEVNRSGELHYFLWIGIWNTMQSGDAAESRRRFDNIVLFVDGEPLPLEAAGWTPEAINASEPVYARPVASALDVYYPVTADQLRLIAGSSDIVLRPAGPAAGEFQLWDAKAASRAGFGAFVQRR